MPSGTTSKQGFYYAYVLQSLKDGNKYVGYTNDLRRRVEEHRKGLSFATSFRLPVRLIYYEACLDEVDARRREGYLKSTDGRRFLAKRLKHFLFF